MRTHTSQHLGDVRSAVKEFLPNADLIVPDYPAGLFASTDPNRVAEQLVLCLDQAIDQRAARPDRKSYDHILFIGHSAGALLLRKTYVIAMGYDSDTSVLGKTNPRSWAAKREARLLPINAFNGFAIGSASSQPLSSRRY